MFFEWSFNFVDHFYTVILLNKNSFLNPFQVYESLLNFICFYMMMNYFRLISFAPNCVCVHNDEDAKSKEITKIGYENNIYVCWLAHSMRWWWICVCAWKLSNKKSFVRIKRWQFISQKKLFNEYTDARKSVYAHKHISKWHQFIKPIFELILTLAKAKWKYTSEITNRKPIIHINEMILINCINEAELKPNRYDLAKMYVRASEKILKFHVCINKNRHMEINWIFGFGLGFNRPNGRTNEIILLFYPFHRFQRISAFFRIIHWSLCHSIKLSIKQRRPTNERKSEWARFMSDSKFI